ncbi:peroxidase 57-like [Silene latifolia]|uniref:peroxidase 57-like n=1 Tax=Silene latifolia TaxID=37657 RepID=UPI003D7727BB
MPVTLSIHVGYYSTKCPQAESIVRQVVIDRFSKDKSIAAALLRMHFHDCFVTGCDASILIDSTDDNQSEKEAGPNLTVREYSLIDEIKSKLEAACPNKVSCADIIALATRDAVGLAGGPNYKSHTGRRDGLVSRASDVDLPGPSFTISQSLKAFLARGLTLKDMVALLGGHTVGITHCGFFNDRLSNFQGTGAPDTSMDTSLVNKLKGVCSSSNNPRVDRTTSLDQDTPFVFDNKFYNEIKSKKGVLKIDQNLADDPLSAKWVSNFAANNTIFQEGFVKAILKLGNIQILQGNGGGEVRRNCRVFNK